MSSDNITSSEWGALLQQDLAVAKTIVIIGLSLNYDLDLSRIFFGSNVIEKVIIIERDSLSVAEERKLSRYGKVFKIGINGFAQNIQNIKKSYKPIKIDYQNYLYTCFLHEYKNLPSIFPPKPQDVFDFFMNGNFTDSLLNKPKDNYTSIIFRNCIYKILESIDRNKRVIFLHSDLGNGKTTIINILRAQLSTKDIHVFILQNDFQSTIQKEISLINTINEKVVIIIEDYFNYKHIIKSISLCSNSNITLILTARTAINEIQMYDVSEMLNIREGESLVLDANRLDSREVEQCSSVFSRYGIWGRLNSLSDLDKIRILKSRERGNFRFQTILIDIAKSNEMNNRINQIVSRIKEQSNSYYEALVLILLSSVMKLNISSDDLSKIMNIDIIRDVTFQNNIAVKELINFFGFSMQ